jgi:hypothetical protein
MLFGLVRVVLMHTVEQATVDKSANVVAADLDRDTKKPRLLLRVFSFTPGP